MNVIYATWCSFCCSEEASGDMMIDGDPFPVCDNCIENYDDRVQPIIDAMTKLDGIS